MRRTIDLILFILIYIRIDISIILIKVDISGMYDNKRLNILFRR